MAAAMVWAEPEAGESAAVRIGTSRVLVEWRDRWDVIPVADRIAGLNEGLRWVAERAAYVRRPLEVRIIWPEDARMALVQPDGRYHWLDVGGSGL